MFNTEFVENESRGSYSHGSTPVALHASWNGLSFPVEMTDDTLPETLNEFGLLRVEDPSGGTALVVVGRRAARPLQEAVERANIRLAVVPESTFTLDDFMTGRLVVAGEMVPTRAALRGFVGGAEAPPG